MSGLSKFAVDFKNFLGEDEVPAPSDVSQDGASGVAHGQTEMVEPQDIAPMPDPIPVSSPYAPASVAFDPAQASPTPAAPVIQTSPTPAVIAPANDLLTNLETVEKLIAALDRYRSLPEEDRSVAAAFATGGNNTDEAAVIHAMLHVPQSRLDAIALLGELLTLDDIDRMVTLIRAPESQVRDVAGFVGAPSEDDLMSQAQQVARTIHAFDEAQLTRLRTSAALVVDMPI